jgi:hypothetical protein
MPPLAEATKNLVALATIKAKFGSANSKSYRKTGRNAICVKT